MKRVFLVICSLLALTFTAPAYSADPTAASFDEKWVASEPSEVGQTGIDMSQAIQMTRFSSFLLSMYGDDHHTDKVTACTSTGDVNCQGFNKQQFRSKLVICSATITSDCLKSLLVFDGTNKPVDVVLKKDVLTQGIYNFQGDPSLGLATGGNPEIFSIPGATHNGGDLYLVSADLVGARNDPTANFEIVKFESSIIPVSYGAVPQNLQPTGVGTAASQYPNLNYIASGGGSYSCIYTDGKVCLQREAFPDGFTFGLDLRLSSPVFGWLQGRFKSPDVTVAENPVVKEGLDLKIIAEPIRVPNIYGWVPTTSLPKDLLDLYTPTPRYGSAWGADRNGDLALTSILHSDMDPSNEVLKEITSWLTLIGDKANNSPTMWFLQTMTGGVGGPVSECTTDSKSLAGIVTTNATMYSPGPPALNADTQSLDYKVVAPHYTRTGEVFKGIYDLVMSSKVARCIYKFTDAPISATISIVSSEGTPSVATITLTEKNNFLHLAAYGFEFSAPTLKIKLEQAAQVVTPPIVVTPPVVVAPKAAKKTLTCLKGKLMKKVTAIKPVCPKGFKVKK